MSATDWANLNLLWDGYPNQGTPNQKSRALLRAIAEFTIHPSDATVWRGQSSHLYRLCPAAARGATHLDPPISQPDLEARTNQLLSRALEASRSWREGLTFRSLTPIEQLSHLQHHGPATPLIDLTPDPMVALWMACATSSADAAGANDGLLLGFNVTDNRWVDVSDHTADYGQVIVDLNRQEKVGWSRPPVSNDRIVVQRSRFLISGIDYASRWHEHVSYLWLPDLPAQWLTVDSATKEARQNALFEPGQGRPPHLPVLAFRIPEELKSTLLDVLKKHYGISQATIYPDSAGGLRK